MKTIVEILINATVAGIIILIIYQFIKNKMWRDLFILAAVMIVLASCNQYPAQKKPWSVGTSPLYFNNITVPYTPPLTVTAYAFDSFDNYDGGYHFFYSVKDADGKEFTHVIDYQLKK